MNYPEDPCRIFCHRATQGEQWYRTHQEHRQTLSRELNLGQHTFLLMADGSMEVIAHQEWAACRQTESGVSLTSEEAYRLFIALQEQFRQHEPL